MGSPLNEYGNRKCGDSDTTVEILHSSTLVANTPEAY